MNSDELNLRFLHATVNSFVRYAVEHGVSPMELGDIFDEGIVRVAETYAESHPLRKKVMIA